MRLNSLAGKEIINLYDGARLGMVGDSELLIDIDSGRVDSIIVPANGALMSFFYKQKDLVIPWRAVKKVGNEVIIVELEESNDIIKRHSI